MPLHRLHSTGCRFRHLRMVLQAPGNQPDMHGMAVSQPGSCCSCHSGNMHILAHTGMCHMHIQALGAHVVVMSMPDVGAAWSAVVADLLESQRSMLMERGHWPSHATGWMWVHCLSISSIHPVSMGQCLSMPNYRTASLPHPNSQVVCSSALTLAPARKCQN